MTSKKKMREGHRKVLASWWTTADRMIQQARTEGFADGTNLVNRSVAE